MMRDCLLPQNTAIAATWKLEYFNKKKGSKEVHMVLEISKAVVSEMLSAFPAPIVNSRTLKVLHFLNKVEHF